MGWAAARSGGSTPIAPKSGRVERGIFAQAQQVLVGMARARNGPHAGGGAEVGSLGPLSSSETWGALRLLLPLLPVTTYRCGCCHCCCFCRCRDSANASSALDAIHGVEPGGGGDLQDVAIGPVEELFEVGPRSARELCSSAPGTLDTCMFSKRLLRAEISRRRSAISSRS